MTSRRPDQLVAALVWIAGVVVIGVLSGILWWWAAPLARADVEQGAVFLRGHAELQVAQDCWFAVVTGAVGVLTATVHGWRPPAGRTGAGRLLWRGGHPAQQLLLLVVSLLLVGVVALLTGTLLGPADLASQAAGGEQHPLTPLRLHTTAALLVGPFLFSFTSFISALLGATPSRRTTTHHATAP